MPQGRGWRGGSPARAGRAPMPDRAAAVLYQRLVPEPRSPSLIEIARTGSGALRRFPLRTASIRAVAAYAMALVLGVAIEVWLLKLWQEDLTVPLDYRGGDAFFYAALIKAIKQSGWFLHNAMLGMPSGQRLEDFPQPENLHWALIMVLLRLSSNYAAAQNLFFLLSFPLTVVTSMVAFRAFGVSSLSAALGSLLFAFLPCHFLRGEMHLFLAAYYMIPPAVMVMLWICRSDPLFRRRDAAGRPVWNWREPKGLAALVICLLVAEAGAYYAVFALFLLVVAGLFALLHNREPGQCLAALALGAVVLLALLVSVAPTLWFTMRDGPNPALARQLAESEVYGLKLAQLLMPVQNHRLKVLREARSKYDARALPMTTNENSLASLGLVGSAGFLFLVGWLLFGRGESANPLFGSLATLNLAGVLLGTIGGFGALIASLLSPQLRAYNRISVYIAFFSLFAVVLLIDALRRRLTQARYGNRLFYLLLALVLAGGIFDQTSPAYVPDYARFRADHQSDADFVARIEASLPQGAMIFQLPYVEYPESLPRRGRMVDYDLFRGYLNSRSLRWSYGAMKGRPTDAWQRAEAAKPAGELIEDLAIAGFAGIYIDLYGYQPEQGATLVAELSGLLDASARVSANGRLVFFTLAPEARRLRARYTAAELRARRAATIAAIRARGPG